MGEPVIVATQQRQETVWITREDVERGQLEPGWILVLIPSYNGHPNTARHRFQDVSGQWMWVSPLNGRWFVAKNTGSGFATSRAVAKFRPVEEDEEVYLEPIAPNTITRGMLINDGNATMVCADDTPGAMRFSYPYTLDAYPWNHGTYLWNPGPVQVVCRRPIADTYVLK